MKIIKTKQKSEKLNEFFKNLTKLSENKKYFTGILRKEIPASPHNPNKNYNLILELYYTKTR